MPTQIAMIVSVIAAAVLVVGALIAARRITGEARDEAARAAESLVAEARRNAEARAQDILAAAQEQALAGEVESDRRERDLDARETKIEALVRQRDNEVAALERQRKELERKQGAVAALEESAKKLREAAEAQSAEAMTKLERIAGLSLAEARAELLASIEAETRSEASKLARKIEEEAREGADRAAARMVVDATQRVSLKGPVESTISFIALPSDEMKGRIIGREGRNIRALEMATGIDVIIDDTPGAILVSSFDPVRREVARIVIERLLEDGRIHPARIEEVVAKVREEFESLTEEAGSQSAFGLGVFDVHPRLARLVGRLKYRSFHGHNLLQHVGEVVHLGAHIAAETGARGEIVRRAALLHEIGRVEDGATGHPLLVAAELAGKFGERDEVVKAIQALHPDAEPKAVEALILRIANRISENRPGARKDNLDVFIERLRRIETLARAFPGVTQAFALKAGKELRVLVDTKSVSDDQAYVLSKQIARGIERELEYPGTIRVSVVRETRSVQYAV